MRWHNYPEIYKLSKRNFAPYAQITNIGSTTFFVMRSFFIDTVVVAEYTSAPPTFKYCMIFFGSGYFETPSTYVGSVIDRNG